MALKCCDVAREGYDVENRHRVSIDTRTATSFQIVLIQVSINLTFITLSDRGYGPHVEVNVVSMDFAIIGVMPAHVLEIT